MKLNQFVFTNILLLFSLILFSACGSDHDDHDDHDETPVGLVLTSSNGTDIAMQEETTVTYTEGSSIVVSENGQITIEVQFIAEDGDRFIPDDHDGYSLAVNVDNSEILSITHPFNNDEWAFTLNGLTAGSTTITFDLLHVGHSDFESRPFQVTVTEIVSE